jgi:hypothetical protein
MELNIPLVLQTVLEDYTLPINTLPINGDHGVSHWARVLENGLRLAEGLWHRVPSDNPDDDEKSPDDDEKSPDDDEKSRPPK